MPAGKQQAFDWDRESRRAIMRRAKLPDDRRAEDGTLVPAQKLYVTLVVLEDHGSARDCFPGVKTIASEARQSVRTTQRALDVLEDLGLIVRERKRPWNAARTDKRTLVHYTIVWSELAVLCPKPASQTLGILAADAPDQSAVAPHQSAVAPDQSAVATQNRAHKEATPFETPTGTPPPPNPQPFHPTSGAAEEDWAAAGIALSQVKDQYGATLAWWSQLLRKARRSGWTPADVHTAIETYQEQRHKFGSIAALGNRLKGLPWPVDGVQPPEVIREARRAKARAAAELQGAAARAEEEAGDRRRELAALEVAYGAELDALTPELAEELACCVFPTAFERECWRRKPREYGRYERLVAIHANRSEGNDGDSRESRVESREPDAAGGVRRQPAWQVGTVR